MLDIDPSQASDKPLNLVDFAQRHQITEDRVWELIEEGELAARFVNDEILIMKEQEAAENHAEPRVDPMPEQEFAIEIEAIETGPIDIPARPGAMDDREPAMRDLPPLPNDENRDLLMFAQDAMNRTMDLSRQLLATKDELIRLKEEKIHHLQAELQQRDLELRRLKRKVEDLETLCRLAPNP